jgi:hypothetical protein
MSDDTEIRNKETLFGIVKNSDGSPVQEVVQDGEVVQEITNKRRCLEPLKTRMARRLRRLRISKTRSWCHLFARAPSVAAKPLSRFSAGKIATPTGAGGVLPRVRLVRYEKVGRRSFE